MAGKQSKTSQPNQIRGPLRPADTPEERQGQLIALAMDVAEQQMRNGTASSQVITHFLKAGSLKEQLELEKLKRENRLLEAKSDALESAARVEQLYADAIQSFGIYHGDIPVPDEEDV